MGAEQSASRPGASAAAAVSQKTCYYELLGLTNLATDEEIRRAYKRKALELHPDRNLDDVETATKRFAEVQTAYEVLSDVHERAWYDSHRDAILRGDDNPSDPADEPGVHYNVKLTTADHIFALVGKFDNSVPMTDAPAGFYGILRETFDHLAMEEAAASQAEAVDILEYPSFGNVADDYTSTVRPFYAVWSSFSTRKSFAWKDKYRLSDAPDRRMRRLMEKENKKLRSNAAREFNDAVRSLVQFVRKRDKRCAAAAAASRPQTEEAMRKAAAEQSARARAANREKMGAPSEFIVPDWVKSGNEGENEGEFLESEEDSVVEEIECVICDKTFKTDKAFESHEKSKKHMKAVQRLKRQMREENKNLDLDAAEQANRQSQAPSVATGSNFGDIPDIILIPELTDSFQTDKVVERKEEDQKMQATADKKEDEAEQLTENSEQDSDYAPREALEYRLHGKKHSSISMDPTSDMTRGFEEPTFRDKDTPEAESEKKMGKAKLKRQKKAAKQQQAVEQDISSVNKCGVCNNIFPSRTQLFKHIKGSNHAQPITIHHAQSKAKGGRAKR